MTHPSLSLNPLKLSVALWLCCVSCVGELDGNNASAPGASPKPGTIADPGEVTPGADGGEIIASGGDMGGEAEEPELKPMPLRRLTRLEYRNTVRDLFDGDVTLELDDLPQDTEVGGFDNNAQASAVDSVLMRAYLEVSETIAAEVVTEIEGFESCEQGEQLAQGRACAEARLATWGEAIWRRPLDPSELKRVLDLYEQGRVDEDSLVNNHHRAGLQYMVSYLFLAPPFLYRLEGPAGPASVERQALSGWEMASRLSYFLWRSSPDEALREAARSGALNEEQGILEQVERMLDDERAEETLAEFHKGWLGYTNVQDESIPRSAELFPDWVRARPHLLEASRRQLSWLILEQGADFEELLKSPAFFASADTAPLYGIKDFNEAEGAWQRFERPGERFGVLTDPSFLAITGRPTYVSPVLRGYVLRERLLCDTVAEPEAGIPEAEVALTPDGQALEQDPFGYTMTDPNCAGCHVNMNPAGYGLSHYDAVGGYAPDFNGEERSASGYLFMTDVPEPFEGTEGLADRLVSSQQARSCLTRRWFRYAHGYHEGEEHEALIAELNLSLDGSVRELITSITVSPTFRYR